MMKRNGAMERSSFTEEHRIFRDAFGRYLDREVVPYYENGKRMK